jgi:acyl-CoA thioesterase FadM
VDRFPFVHHETVRFRDLNGMGHVNNAVFSGGESIPIPDRWRKRLSVEHV